MISTNEVIFRTHQRLSDDAELTQLLVGGTGVVNGPRRPDGYANPCVTIGVLTNTAGVRPAHQRTMLVVNVYATNLAAEGVKGLPDTYRLSAIAQRVAALMDGHPLQIAGVINSQMELAEPLGPQFDPQDPSEHFMSLRFRSTFR